MIDQEQTPEEVILAARSRLLRGSMLYGAFLVLALAALLTLVANGLSGGMYVWLAIVLIVIGLLAHLVWQHTRDMGSAPVQTEGVIARKWQRAELIIAWQGFYVHTERKIFRLDPRDYIMVEQGVRVRITHYPRTLSVIRMEVVKANST